MKFYLPKTCFCIILGYKKGPRSIVKICTALLIILLSFITFQNQAFAKGSQQDPKLEVAEKYRAEGYTEQQKGNLDKALTAYTKVLSLGLEDAGLYNDLGVLYEQLGLPADAEAYYLKAIGLDSNYLPPYMNLAYIYKERGDTAKAIRYFEKRVFYGDPNDFWTRRAQEELKQLDPSIEQRRKTADAKRLSQELIEKEHAEFVERVARSDRRYQAGQKLVKEKQYDQAIAQYNQALLLTPDNPKILKARKDALLQRTIAEVKMRSEFALRHLDMGDTFSAREEYRRILTIIPKEPFQVSE